MLNCGLPWPQHFHIIVFCGGSFCLKIEHLVFGCREKRSICFNAGPPQSCLENCDILLSFRCFLSSEKGVA